MEGTSSTGAYVPACETEKHCFPTGPTIQIGAFGPMFTHRQDLSQLACDCARQMRPFIYENVRPHPQMEAHTYIAEITEVGRTQICHLSVATREFQNVRRGIG